MTNEEKAKLISEQFHCDDVAYDAAEQMAEWKEQQMIEKACEWLKDNANEYLDWYDWERCRLNKDELLHDFREAMKGE